jgi:hypothetical protein
LSSEHLNQLFGELRSALNEKDLLKVHNISKELIKTDYEYYQNVVVNYLSSSLNSQGDSMDPNTHIRIEHFKAWVRGEINGNDKIRNEAIIGVLKEFLFAEERGVPLAFHNNRYTIDVMQVSLEFPSSIRFIGKKNLSSRSLYYLEKEFQDALWVVLDEHGLL